MTIFDICNIVGQRVVLLCHVPFHSWETTKGKIIPHKLDLEKIASHTRTQQEEVFVNVRLKDELLLRITGFSTFQFIGFKFERKS